MAARRKREPAHPPVQTTSCSGVERSVKRTGFWLGIAIFVLMLVLPEPAGISPAIWTTVALGLLMVAWWMTEAVPLPATALLPAIVLPLAEIMPVGAAITPYANPVIFLFLGGFIIAIAIQKSRLHLRIALGIVYLIGTRPDRMIAGFMIATGLLSMWISNTATMLMMLPIGLSVVELMKDKLERAQECASERFAVSLLLTLAFASSIGGIGTLIGTPPNAIMNGYMQQTYGLQIPFGQWMMVGIPMVVIMLLVLWLVMTKLLYRLPNVEGPGARRLITRELGRLGPMSREERFTAIIAGSTALLWTFNPLISMVVPISFDDTVIALMGGLAMLAIPINARQHSFLLSWGDAAKLPWGVLILFGGGLSLASGIEASGMAVWLADLFRSAGNWPPLLLLVVVTLTLMLTTSLMSNVASINIFLPIIVPMAIAMQMHPLYFTIPATMAASLAFLLPVSTASNAIAFGTGQVTIPQMVRAGLLLNLIALPVLIALTYLIAMPVFDIQVGALPAWAE